MRRLLLVGCLLVGCKRSAPPAPAPAPAPMAPVPPAERRASPDQAGRNTFTLDTFGIQVEALACAELTVIDADSVGVGPSAPSCPLKFPGAVFTRTLNNVASTLEEELASMKTDQPPPQITRAEKTATGWIVEWTKPASGEEGEHRGVNEYFALGTGKPFVCIAWGAYSAAELAELSSICASVRPVK